LTAAQQTPAELAACAHLLNFTTYTYPEYLVNWHHRLICEHLDAFATQQHQRLMIFAQPRSGKSELVSRRLPAYILGRNPNASIIAASYGADLARRMNRDVQRIMDEESYLRLFPDTRLSGRNVRADAQGSYLRNSDMFEVVDHQVRLCCVGRGRRLEELRRGAADRRVLLEREPREEPFGALHGGWHQLWLRPRCHGYQRASQGGRCVQARIHHRALQRVLPDRGLRPQGHGCLHDSKNMWQ
jgi:hypothetical protein